MNINDELNNNQRQELNHSHPAVVLYSRPNVSTVLVAPLTSKKNESDVVIYNCNINEKYILLDWRK